MIILTKIKIVPKLTVNHWKALFLNPKTAHCIIFLNDVEYVDIHTKETITINGSEIRTFIINDIKDDLILISAFDKYKKSENDDNEDIDIADTNNINNKQNINNDNNNNENMVSIMESILISRWKLNDNNN